MMKRLKLTKLQRHTAYIIMLVEAKSGEWGYAGLCNMTTDLFTKERSEKDPFYSYGGENFKRLYPELYRKRDGDFWFSDWAKRISAIKQCIKETY